MFYEVYEIVNPKHRAPIEARMKEAISLLKNNITCFILSQQSQSRIESG